MTEPQKHLANRKLGYNRGKGLGGSSAINFCFYTRGAKADFDEWARRVGDDFFNWENAERRFKKLEGFSTIETESHKKYADWKPENHGMDGPVKVSDSKEWENFHENVIEAGYQNGWKKNMDVNSGDPIGVGVCATTGSHGKRTTAATAYLNSAPSNLEIVTDALATKIIFDGKKAVGITAGGKDYFAKNELVLSAGALDTPKLLMLSGVGPQAELAKHGISQVADLPVGQGLQDHLHFSMVVETEEGTNLRAKWSTPEHMAKATEQFKKDGTGPLSIMHNSAAVGFAKGSDSIYESQEFRDLPEDIQAYIKQPTVPSYEFAGVVPNAPLPGFDPAKTYQTVMVRLWF
jgi:choline dehydrogenase-like flavoprotein